MSAQPTKAILAAVWLAALFGCASLRQVKRPSADSESRAPLADSSASVDTLHLTDSTSADSITVADSGGTALSPAARMIIAACDNYLAINPQTPKAGEVMSIKASVLYNRQSFEASREVYLELLEKLPGNPHADDAMKMIAQSYYQQKQFDEAQQWFRKLSQSASKGVDKIEAIERIAESIFRMAETHEAAQRYEKAAMEYERASLEFPESGIADISLFNAGLMREKQTEWARAILVYERLRQRYEQSKLAPKAMFRTGKCYEKQHQWEKAAQTYLRLAAFYPKTGFASAGLYNAGFAFDNAQKPAEAAATFEKLAYVYPDAKEAPDVLFKAGEIYGTLKDWPNVTRINQEFSRRYGDDIDRVVQAQCMVGVALYMQNKPVEAIQQLQQALRTFRKLHEPSTVNTFYAAKAQFTIAEIYHTMQNDIALTLPRQRYKRLLSEKSSLLDQALAAYSAVIEHGISEWTTRSIFQIGMLYEDFAMGVFKQERPADATLEQTLSLELGIAQAMEEYFVENALHFHEQNVKLGVREKIENKHILASKQKLTYLTCVTGETYLSLAGIARQTDAGGNLRGFSLIAHKLGLLQKIAPYQEKAIALFLTCLEMGAKYQEQNEFYRKASALVTESAFSVGETYAEVALIARDAPVPESFDAYERFVYKTRLLNQIEGYENSAIENYLKTLKIAHAYTIDDLFVRRAKNRLPEILFIRGRSYDLLCEQAFADPPFPAGIGEKEKEEYQARFEEIGLRLQEQAFEMYRTIFEYAGKNYAEGEFVNHSYVRLYQFDPRTYGTEVKKTEDRSFSSGPQWKCGTPGRAGWHALDFNDRDWHEASKGEAPDSITVRGFPQSAPAPMWGDSSFAAADSLCFRRTFYTREPPHEAFLYIAAPDSFAVMLNGEPLTQASAGSCGWPDACRSNLTGMLRQGKNVLAVKAWRSSPAVYGIMPYLQATVTVGEYLPVFPGTAEPLDKKIVEKGVWVFPEIKNFSWSSANAFETQKE